MYRRYKPKRKSSSHALPITAVLFTVVALLIWGFFAKWDDMVRYVKGDTVVVKDDTEANRNLDNLLADLSGDRPRLIKLAEDRTKRLGWIKSDETRRRFLWVLVSRLVDEGEWHTAKPIVPEVEAIAPVEGLDRIAALAKEKKDYEFQLKLDKQLQNRLVNEPAETTPLLLNSIRRYVDSCEQMDKKNEAYQALDILKRNQVNARLKSNPELAVEAAALKLRCAEVSGALQAEWDEVRNLLEGAGWPSCPATGKLLLNEASQSLKTAGRTKPELQAIQANLLKSLDSLLKFPDTDRRLPECYTLLGDVCYRLGQHEACVQYITLADAFARGYGVRDEALKEMELKHRRMRARANEARGAIAEAMVDYRYLLDNEKDQNEVFKSLSFMATHAQGEEKIVLLKRCWDMLKANESLVKSGQWSFAQIAKEIADFYVTRKSYAEAISWVKESVRIVEESNPDLTDGKALRARLNLALIERKTERNDGHAVERLKLVVRAIEQMDEESRAKLDAADPKLYADAVREFARTYLVMGGKYNEKIARQVIRKIKEPVPTKLR
ncbi:MAG: hypothetical protein IJA63_11215 [Akkermansia sp.]|nr:hypothetical protein [Akkermansia sp.]